MFETRSRHSLVGEEAFSHNRRLPKECFDIRNSLIYFTGAMDLYPSLRENKHLFCTDILFIITNHSQDSTLTVLVDLSYGT
jgi:hypothetical protein